MAAFQELAGDTLDGGGAAGAAGTSLKKALVSGMMQLLKAGIAVGKPKGRLPELLVALGAGEEAVASALRMSSGRRSESERSRGMKRSRDEAAGKAVVKRARSGAEAVVAAGPPATSPMELNHVRRMITGFRRAGNFVGLEHFLGQLPPPVLADIVLAGMSHCLLYTSDAADE